MPSLYVQRSVEIDAPAMTVWDVLTRREFNSQWAPEFTSGSPFYIDSTWETGITVRWKDAEGRVLVEGQVMAREPHKLLRFTVLDVNDSSGYQPREEDGITYRLWEKNGRTTLDIMQGDFSLMPDGAKYHELTAKTWERVLPKIKKLAELAERR
jgi:uncharacterized protein YndB with AHSA1/START domain